MDSMPFKYCPVTKGLLLTTSLSSLACATGSASVHARSWTLHASHALSRNLVLRILRQQCAFQTLGQMLQGAVLLYQVQLL